MIIFFFLQTARQNGVNLVLAGESSQQILVSNKCVVVNDTRESCVCPLIIWPQNKKKNRLKIERQSNHIECGTHKTITILRYYSTGWGFSAQPSPTSIYRERETVVEFDTTTTTIFQRECHSIIGWPSELKRSALLFTRTKGKKKTI